MCERRFACWPWAGALGIVLALQGCASSDQSSRSTPSQAATASQQPEPVRSGRATRTVVEYRCAGGETVQVSYFGSEAEAGAPAELNLQGRIIPMQAALSATGAHYTAEVEDSSYRWSRTNDQAALSVKASNNAAKEVAVLTECRVQRQLPQG